MPGQQFRPGKSSIVPFVEAELNKDLHSKPVAPYIVREVIVSPCPDPQLSIDALTSIIHSTKNST
jgi:hypothetical protein